jgi:uncharacterized protein YjbI with pentapeptide repeats
MQTGSVPERLNYEESCRFLQTEGWLKVGDIPPLPARPPRYDDEILGVEFFRTWVGDAKLENLTLPRTYFSRTEIKTCSFAGCDLSESVANWNDFVDVNFSAADLSRFDFRGCNLTQINFGNSILRCADLRCCSFEGCDFTGADLINAKITKEVGASIDLTPAQRETIDWQDSDGADPDGG